MKNIIPLLIIGLALTVHIEGNGQSRPKTDAEKIDSAFNYHLNLVSQYLQDRVNNASTPWARSENYLETITGIPASGDWTYFGKIGLRMEDIYEWKQWYNQNKQLLIWDNKLKSIRTARDRADAEKYAQASEYILSQRKLWKTESINLIDSLVYIPVSVFDDELDKVYHYANKREAFDSLKILNAKRNFAPIYWNGGNKSKFETTANVALYFSKVYSNQLTAAVIDNRPLPQGSRKNTLFLFEFDPDNRITKIHLKQIIKP